MPKVSAVTALILLAVTGLGSQQDKEAKKLLEKVGRTYNNLKSYSFESITTIETKADRIRQKVEFRESTAVVKPDKVRVETTNMLVVSDGRTIWSYAPQLKEYTRKDVSAAKASPGSSQELSLLNLPQRPPYGQIAQGVIRARILREETLEIEGKSFDCIVVEVEYDLRLPASIKQSPKTFWIDKARNIVLRESYTMSMESSAFGPTETKRTTTFTAAKLNEPLSDSLFAFVPPEGAKEVERLSIWGGVASDRAANLKGREAFDFTLKDLDGREVNLKSLRGKVVLLSFWATWCGPCRAEMPLIEKLHREFKDRGLVVLGINSESPEIAREFFRKNKYTFTSLVDDRGEVFRSYQASSIPMVVVIGRDGKILATRVGYSPQMSEYELRDFLKKAGIN